MWKATLPYLRRTLWKSKGALALVLASALVAGSFATLKSLIESQIISAVAGAVDSNSAGSVWNSPLGAVSDPDSDVVTNLANLLVGNLDFRFGLVVYLAVSLLGAALVIATTAARESISQRLFSQLFAAGLERSFSGSELLEVEDDEPGGRAGAIQQGAGAVSSAYALCVEAGQYFFTLATIIFVLTRVSYAFAGLLLGVTAAMAFMSWLQGRRLSDGRESYDHHRKSLIGFTSDVLENRDVLLAHERKPVYVQRLRETAHEFGAIDRALTTRESIYQGSVNVIQDFGQIAILAIVLVAATSGTDVTSVGDAYFYVSLFARVMAPIRNLLSSYDGVRRSMSTSHTLVALLADRGNTERGHDESTAADAVSMEFKEVEFDYPHRKVFTRCNFTVPMGSVTLIVGRSGAGKTTLARLMLGFLHPRSGEVSVMGRSTVQWEHGEMLQHMSYLSQTGHVIKGSVRENLFASDESDSSELLHCLREAGLAEQLGHGVEVLDLPADNLSEGQMQRLALARILADKSPVVILDEPLAGVDAFTFGEVRESLKRWMRDPARTVVIISHRLAFASAATHVVVLGDGHIEEEGTPRELLERPSGVFASLAETARSEILST